jgi:inward rectifier potassium channel
MANRHRKEIYRFEGYDIHILGAPRPGLRDLYHGLLRVPWWATFALIVGGYLLLNVLFAVLYLMMGGVANVQSGSFLDAFFFSVQTMGTIGYGAMYPITRAAHFLVVAESVVGLVVTALATGLVFARFSQVRARLMFSRVATISPMDNVPTLTVRIGNERRSAIIDAHFRMTLTRTTRTSEGVTIYRATEMKLMRNRAAALARSWMIAHRIEPGSPLQGDTPESLTATEVEITIEVSGIDDTALQPVHARKVFPAASIVWGARLADVITETEDKMIIDLAKFHDIELTALTESFPYP